MASDDAIERAAQVLSRDVTLGYRDDAGDDAWAYGVLDGDERRTLARALADAGLILTPEREREIKAAAWDEGRASAGISLPTDPPKQPTNPYREGADDE